MLEFPHTLKEQGMSSDLEVGRLSTSTEGGHPSITLGLRSPPDAREADRHSITFVFAADDSFVLLSRPVQKYRFGKLVSDCRLEYDHLDGRPVLRSLVTTIVDQVRTMKLDVEECRFGPIPETEFAARKSFLADHKPFEIIRKPVVEPAIPTFLGWHWVAFVAGGISLACGSGLALRGRGRGRWVCEVKNE